MFFALSDILGNPTTRRSRAVQIIGTLL